MQALLHVASVAEGQPVQAAVQALLHAALAAEVQSVQSGASAAEA